MDNKMSVKEAAQALKVKTSTIYEWIYSGHLNAEKVDGRYFIAAEDVERILKEGKTWGRRLTPEQVVEIRRLKGTMPFSEIARKYKVSLSLISRIMSRERWKDV